MPKKKSPPRKGRDATVKPKAPAKKAPKTTKAKVAKPWHAGLSVGEVRPYAELGAEAVAAGGVLVAQSSLQPEKVKPRIVQGCIGPIHAADIRFPGAAAPKKGRPSLYSIEVVSLLCGRIAGGMTLTAVCKMDDMPHIATAIRWLSDVKDKAKDAFRAAYACAREAWIQQMADEVLAISDDGSQDTKIVAGRDGEPVAVYDAEYAARSKLRVDARKWMLSKLAPGKYGDKVTAVLEGGEKPVQVQDVSPETAAKVAERFAIWNAATAAAKA